MTDDQLGRHWRVRFHGQWIDVVVTQWLDAYQCRVRIEGMRTLITLPRTALAARETETTP